MNSTLPEHFVSLADSRIKVSLAYAGNENFIGRPIAGYEANIVIVTRQAAQALIAVQDELDTYQQGYRLKIFDAYRPLRALEDFTQWWFDTADQKNKANYYPDLEKADLFQKGYLAATRSAHTRGSTFDLTIIQSGTTNDVELDMGTPFDFFAETSHTASTAISGIAQKNRQFLKSVMEKHGFKNYAQEWWHYTLIDEPYSNTYFDFPVCDDYLLP